MTCACAVTQPRNKNMTDKEKLETLDIIEELAIDLYDMATIRVDDINGCNETLAKGCMMEEFGQILRKRWNIDRYVMTWTDQHKTKVLKGSDNKVVFFESELEAERAIKLLPALDEENEEEWVPVPERRWNKSKAQDGFIRLKTEVENVNP